MASNIYRHPRPVGPAEHGHDDKCEYTDNRGHSCECDRDIGNMWGASSAYQAIGAMKLLGWKPGLGSPLGQSWARIVGPHVVSMVKLKSGWQIRWDKQMGMTYMEYSGFATITDALDYFWGWMAERVDESNHMSWEYGAMTQQLKDAGIEPRRLDLKPSPPVPAIRGTLKHEVTAMMNKGKEF